MRSLPVPRRSLPGMVVLGFVLAPLCAWAFGGVGVAVGHGGGVGVAAGHGGFGAAVGQGVAAGHGGGFGAAIGHGPGGGQAVGHGADGISGGHGASFGSSGVSAGIGHSGGPADGSDAPGIGAGANPGGGRHGGAGLGAAHGHGRIGEAGDSSQGRSASGPEGDSNASSVSTGAGSSGDDSADNSNTAGVDTGSGQDAGDGARHGSAARSKTQAAYQSHRAKFLQERSMLEMGMGPTRPDRGVEGALRWARMHPQGWSWGSAGHARGRASAAGPNFEPAFSSTVASLSALPSVKIGHPLPAALPAGLRAIDPPVPFHSAAASIDPQRSLFRETKRAVPSPLLNDQKDWAADDVIGPAPDPPVAAVQPWAQGDFAAAKSAQMRTSLIDEGRSATAPQAWSMVGPFSSETQPLSKRGPIILIVLLSALSAYMFVRWTSVKCPQCGKLLEPGSLSCGRCHSRSGSIKV